MKKRLFYDIETSFCQGHFWRPGWNKTYTTAQGTIQHYMKCRDKECRTTFKINNKTYQDWFKYKVLKGIKH